MTDRVAAVRDFSRDCTRIIGALDEGLLHTVYSLTDARVIFELGTRREADVGELKAALALDAGYLSRILARFDRDGLVVREPSPHDARRQCVGLTATGDQVYRTLGERADDRALALLGGRSDASQQDVVAAMRTIQAKLTRPVPAATTVLRPPRSGDLGWIVERHGVVYAREYGWDWTFEALVARIVAEFVDGFDPRRDAAWIAEVGGERAGCVFCVGVDGETARLRLLLVEPSARGHGVGARLVDECIAFAQSAGFRRLDLWTNDVLVAARRIYERAGFELVDSDEHESFGHHLVGQTWRLELGAGRLS